MAKKKTASKPRTATNRETGGGCEADFEIGGDWGDAVNWNGTKQFSEYPVSDPESRFRCHGWKRKQPEAGQTLKAEFVKSWVIFEFVEVEPCVNPPDMFFAVVSPKQRLLK